MVCCSRCFVSPQMDSLGVVLSQELVKFNKVLAKMNTSLSSLQKAIEGLELMSDELDGMYVDFRNNKVPANWTTVSYASLKPLSNWVLDTQERCEFMRNWLKEGCPNAFPLYLFFFPQGFLTGALQNYARKHMLPINTLDFGFIGKANGWTFTFLILLFFFPLRTALVLWFPFSFFCVLL